MLASDEHYGPTEEDYAVPIPIQTFLWRQTCPFIRPKLGKLHEATCVSLEKVLVQNILFGLSPSLTEAIKAIPRWRLIQAAFPHVMHCTAQLLTNRKISGIQSGLGSSEIKLLYILHWILLDSAEECADADYENNVVPAGSFNYLFSISAITLFVYLFAPLCNQIKVTDFNTFRLENGYRIWPAMWAYRTPDLVGFTCPVKPKRPFDPFFVRKTKKEQCGDVFVGAGNRTNKSNFIGVTGSEGCISTPPPTPEHTRTECSTSSVLEEELEKLAAPVNVANVPFPETIPEESSSNDEEHVMIFRLGSIPESDGIREGTIFKMSVRQSSNESSKTSPSDKQKGPRTDSSPRASLGGRTPCSGTSICPNSKPFKQSGPPSAIPWKNPRLSTFMDVAVVRCLLIAHWEEEGIFWGLSYLINRMEEIVALKDCKLDDSNEFKRQRSNSLPVPKVSNTTAEYNSRGHDDKYNAKSSLSTNLRDSTTGSGSRYGSYSACSSPTSERRQRCNSHRRGSEKGGKRKLTVFDFKTFVETKLLSKSEKMLERIGNEKSNEDASDEQKGEFVARTRSALDQMDEMTMNPCALPDNGFGMESNLFKGKSMPSLRHD